MKLLKVRLLFEDPCYEEIVDESTDFVTFITEWIGCPPEGTDYIDLEEWQDDDDFWDDVYHFVDDKNIGEERTWRDNNNEELFTIEILGYGDYTTGYS